jgi:uncharacterized protein (UPF0147 family)
MDEVIPHYCMNCKRPSNFVSVFILGTRHGENYGIVGGKRRQIKFLYRIEAFDKKGYHDLLKCIACGSIVHGISQETMRNLDRDSILNPSLVSITRIFHTDLDLAIPENIRKDIAEAKSAFNAELPNATATMARRALERMCKDQGATPKTDLWKQIEEVLSHDSQLKGMATEVRLYGNLGAHANLTFDEDVTIDEAECLLDFIDNIVILSTLVPIKLRLLGKNG